MLEVPDPIQHNLSSLQLDAQHLQDQITQTQEQTFENCSNIHLLFTQVEQSSTETIAYLKTLQESTQDQASQLELLAQSNQDTTLAALANNMKALQAQNT